MKRCLLPAALALSALAGCAAPGDVHTTGHLRTTSTIAGGAAGTAQDVAWPSQQWWRVLGDPQLDGLIDRALAGSPSLDVARARFARAQAAVSAARAERQPRLDASVDLQRQRLPANSLYPPPLGGSDITSATGQLSGSWELDFFGRQRAALEAALSQAQAAAAEQQAARIALAASVARAYVQLARLMDARGVAVATQAQRAHIVELVKERVANGLDSKVELRQAEVGVPEITQQLEAIDEQIAVTRHAIAALLGEGPGTTAALTPHLAQTVALPLPQSIPADLVGRRADITAARWRVEAAARDIEIARAQFYPNISLTAFVGLQSFGLSDWLDAGSLMWGVGPALRLPLFDAGRLRANLRGRAADFDAAVASYNGTLVDAVREVADLVAALQSIVRQQRAQRAAQAAAQAAYELATLRYQGGLGNLLTVLTAENSVLTQRRVAVDLAGSALDAQVQLMQALGGGYVADATPADATRTAAAGRRDGQR